MSQQLCSYSGVLGRAHPGAGQFGIEVMHTLLSLAGLFLGGSWVTKQSP